MASGCLTFQFNKKHMPQDLCARMFISALFETDKTKITQMSINKKTDKL